MISPIFVDSTGRRRRLFTVIAAAAGVLLTSAVVILVVGFFGAGPAHLPGLPELQPAQQEVAPVPEPPSSSGSPRPDRAPNASQNGTNPAPTVSTSDDRGNGNRPTHTPNHPQPTKTK